MTATKHFHSDTSWDAIDAQDLGDAYPGVIAKSFSVGDDPLDLANPVVFRTTFPPGFRVEPHTHPCDYAEIILEGSQQVTRRWYHEGDIRIATAGTVYGPLIAGPQGCTVLIVFASGNRRSMWPKAAASSVGT